MRVLIVEDDAILGRLLLEYLQRLNHERVRVCATGGESFAAIESETFDCAFVDLRLPDIDGLRLLEAFKTKDPGLLVVMMSGFPTMEYTIEAMRKGASDFLTKPFTLQNVALTLERVTKERKLLLENLSLQFESQARKELETVNRKLEKKVEEQVRLFDISREIDEVRSSEELYPCIIRLASRLVNVEWASFFALPPERNSLLILAEYREKPGEMSPRVVEVPGCQKMRNLLSGEKTCIMMRPDDLEIDYGLLGVTVSDQNALSCWPLRIRGELFGFLLTCHNGTGKCISPVQMKLLDFLIKKSSLAIENMALYESLIGNFYGILRSLVNALEAKDRYTGKHSERVTQYAVAIAREMKIPVAQVESLKTVGYLHDIGKIGINDTILNKPSALTKDEYEVVKEHPAIGESIVAELGLSLEERSIIRHHHERWDGLGYPDKLSNNDIPLLARVVAVADAYDAMTSKRAYRKAMTGAEAALELIKGRRRQFDPEVLDAFLEVIELRT